MSRGPGIWQRAILDALKEASLVHFRGTRGQRTAQLRAAKALQARGLCSVVRFWNDLHTAVVSLAARPGTLIGGKPIESLSVERVTRGTHATFKGSLRDIAAQERVSVATVLRDLRRADRQRPRKGE